MNIYAQFSFNTQEREMHFLVNIHESNTYNVYRMIFMGVMSKNTYNELKNTALDGDRKEFVSTVVALLS